MACENDIKRLLCDKFKCQMLPAHEIRCRIQVPGSKYNRDYQSLTLNFKTIPELYDS